jgi:hypothetical protein
MRITVQLRSVYGRETVYPACPQSRIFADIAGTRTLTPETLAHIVRLGVEVLVEAPHVTIAA